MIRLSDIPKSKKRQLRGRTSCITCDNQVPQVSYRYCSDRCCDAFYHSIENERQMYLHEQRYQTRLLSNILPGLFAYDRLRRGLHITSLQYHVSLISAYYELVKTETVTNEDWDLFDKWYVEGIVNSRQKFFRCEGVWYMFPPYWQGEHFLPVSTRRACDIHTYLHKEFSFSFTFR